MSTDVNGYNPSAFEKSPSEDLVCPICLGVVKDATEITQCGHIFCDHCIQTWLKTSSTCPVDRSKINKHDVRKIQFIRNKVLNMVMVCKCGTKHSVRSRKHLLHFRDTQKHKNVCENEVSTCFICQKSVRKYLYDSHFADQLTPHFEVMFDRLQKLEAQNEMKEGQTEGGRGAGVSEILALKSDLKKLQTQVTDQASTVKTLQMAVSELQKEVRQLSTKLVSSSENKEHVSDERYHVIEQKFNECQKELVDAKNDISQLQKDSTVESVTDIENKLKVLDADLHFDEAFSLNYFTFPTQQRGVFAQASNTGCTFSDYRSFPVLRLAALPFTEKFSIEFKLSQYGWFGVAAPDLPPHGFPGYLAQGWMISTDGRLWHNRAQVSAQRVDVTSKRCWLYCDPEAKTLLLRVGDAAHEYHVPNMSDEVVFVISISSGQAELHHLKR